MDKQCDGRSPLALGLEWSSKVTTVALEMVIPPAIGYWLDQRLGTPLLFLVSGAVLGFAVGLRNLLQMTRRTTVDEETREKGND